jgi:hypothetical protein
VKDLENEGRDIEEIREILMIDIFKNMKEKN